MRKRNSLSAWILILALGPLAQAQDLEKAMRAMETELKRSLSELKTPDSSPPYFIGYRLTLIDYFKVECAHGDIGSEMSFKRQVPFVEIRVGGYDLDNTWEGFASARYLTSGSLSFDQTALRQAFWYLTDLAYKDAARKYLEKKARLAQELEHEILPDFSKEKPVFRINAASSAPSLDKGLLRRLCRQASAEFKKYPELDYSEVAFTFNQETRLLMNSEGTRLSLEGYHTPYGYNISAEARAPDGLEVSSFRNDDARFSGELPKGEALTALVAGVAQEVIELKKAPLAQPEVAPALLDGVSAGVFFHEALGHRLEGQRQRQKNELQTFKGKIGQRIIPAFLNIVSNPTLENFQGVSISGHYDFDSEGVPSQKVTLVEKGVLKNYLMSRWPIAGFLNSNGHGRSDATRSAQGRMAVLMIEPANPLTAQELAARFLKLIEKSGKGFGFRAIAMRSGEAQTTRGQSQSFVARPRLVYKVDTAGKETLVRGLEYVGTPLAAIEKIAAAGGSQVLENAYCGSASGWVPVSHVAPTLLISELELQREPEERLRPPVIKPPIALKK